MEIENVMAVIGNINIMKYFALNIIFISLYIFTMIILILRIKKGIHQRKIINIQKKTIDIQDKIIKEYERLLFVPIK